MNWQQMRTRLPVVNGACGGDFVWWRNCNGRRHGIQGRIATGINGTFEHEFQRHVRGMQVGVTTGQDWQSIRFNLALGSDRIGSKKFVAHKYAFLYYFRALLCATQTYPYYFRALLCAIQTYPYYYIQEYYIYIQHE